VLRGLLEPALAAGIGVLNERDVRSWLALVQRHSQRVENKRAAHVRRELPAHDPPAVGVDHEAEEHQPLPAAQIREVREPLLIWPRRSEVALNAISRASRRGVGLGSAPGLAAPLGALDVVLAHQAPHTISADILAGPQ
jgi:hypothetical protein